VNTLIPPPFCSLTTQRNRHAESLTRYAWKFTPNGQSKLAQKVVRNSVLNHSLVICRGSYDKCNKCSALQCRSYIWGNRGGRLGCFQDYCLSRNNITSTIFSLCQLTSLDHHPYSIGLTPSLSLPAQESRPTSFTNLLAPGLTPLTLLLTVCSEDLGFYRATQLC